MTIDLARHQRDAVERACGILNAYGGVILADDVGLGKSFVAAEVARCVGVETEFIVPAGLVPQWRRTLAEFGVHGRITTHDRIIHERFFPSADGERLLVVDEAHAFRNPQTQRYDALARRSIGARLMLVTATPICNSPEDMHALTSLIVADDALRSEGVASIDDAFYGAHREEISAILATLVIRRGREVLDEKLAFGRLDRTVVRHEVRTVAIDDLSFPLIDGHAQLLRSILWRRLESSEAALDESLRRQLRFYERALDCVAAGRTLSKRDYREAFGNEDADAFQEVLFWDFFAGNESRADVDAIRAEMGRLDAIRSQLESPLEAARAKTDLLRDVLDGDPALVFTSAIATATDVYRSVAAHRRSGIVTSRGATPANAIDAFAGGAIDVLVCTDLAAEGLNLQRAGMVVHYDLPWNPVKIDQRNGRAFRIGQPREAVKAVFFVPRGGHTRVMRAIAAKNRHRRSVLMARVCVPASQSLTLLPVHLPRRSPAVALLNALRGRGLPVPSGIARRYRAGVERLFAAMSAEYLDERRVSDLTSVLERERIIGRGVPIESTDR
jgi:superfamily II DNA or RNA helicase